MQKQRIQKLVFEFAYYGMFDVDVWKDRHASDIGLQSAELCKGTHGYWYALIRLAKKKRSGQLERIFETYDNDVTPEKQIKLTNLPGEPSIVSFGQGHKFMYHTIYKQIERARETECPSYFHWKIPGYQGPQAPVSSRTASKHNQPDCSEFDVVKKRNRMDSASEGSGSAPDALVSFEEFEASVLPALECFAEDENQYRRQEMMDMDDSLAKGEAMSAIGGVYFAWSQCLGCMKIGATRKEDPHVRLRQLSGLVTTPFILAAWLPTPVPFRMEAAAHLHFKQQRINQRGSGAGTEFFRIGMAEAQAYAARFGKHVGNSCETGECRELVYDQTAELKKTKLDLEHANKELVVQAQTFNAALKEKDQALKRYKGRIQLILRSIDRKFGFNLAAWAEMGVDSIH